MLARELNLINAEKNQYYTSEEISNATKVDRFRDQCRDAGVPYEYPSNMDNNHNNNSSTVNYQLSSKMGANSISNHGEPKSMLYDVNMVEELRREKEYSQQLETDKKDLQEENGQLRREKEDLEKENQQRDMDNKALKEENGQLCREKEDLEEKNQQLGGENKALKEEKKELEQKNKLSDINLQGAKNELESTQLFYKKELVKLADLYKPR